jgi:N-acetylmuramoyl-L-alanine amidase
VASTTGNYKLNEVNGISDQGAVYFTVKKELPWPIITRATGTQFSETEKLRFVRLCRWHNQTVQALPPASDPPPAPWGGWTLTDLDAGDLVTAAGSLFGGWQEGYSEYRTHFPNVVTGDIYRTGSYTMASVDWKADLTLRAGPRAIHRQTDNFYANAAVEGYDSELELSAWAAVSREGDGLHFKQTKLSSGDYESITTFWKDLDGTPTSEVCSFDGSPIAIASIPVVTGRSAGPLVITYDSIDATRICKAWVRTEQGWRGTVLESSLGTSLVLPEFEYPPLHGRRALTANAKGEILLNNTLWRNGRAQSISELVPDLSPSFVAADMNAQGAICGTFQSDSGPHAAMLLPIEVVEVSPKVKDEDGAEVAGSEKPSSGKPLTPFVEIDPNINKIAHRELKVLIGSPLKGKKVTWTLEALPGATPAVIRGDWNNSNTHKDRFEVSTAYGENGFAKDPQGQSKTTVGADGYTAIRVNVPPIGFNQVRIKIQIEGISRPIDLIDMEVPGVIVIDPGHGGAASGPVLFGSSWNNATSPSGVLEKTMALNYGLAVRDALKAKRHEDKLNLRVFMTRELDIGIRGDKRAFIARDNGADVIFIIHFNSFDDGPNAHRVRGTLEVVRDTNNVHPEEDAILSNNIISRMVNAMDAYDTDANHRRPLVYDTAVASDVYNGNTANFHPIRTCYCEVEFIDFGANTAVKTDDLVDILLNTGPNAGAVKTDVANAIRDGILQDMREQPQQ